MLLAAAVAAQEGLRIPEPAPPADFSQRQADSTFSSYPVFPYDPAFSSAPSSPSGFPSASDFPARPELPSDPAFPPRPELPPRIVWRPPLAAPVLPSVRRRDGLPARICVINNISLQIGGYVNLTNGQAWIWSPYPNGYLDARTLSMPLPR